MPAIKPIKQKELIHFLRKLDFIGPYSAITLNPPSSDLKEPIPIIQSSKEIHPQITQIFAD
jgi:hypothetical protein